MPRDRNTSAGIDRENEIREGFEKQPDGNYKEATVWATLFDDNWQFDPPLSE